jgi:nitroreductase
MEKIDFLNIVNSFQHCQRNWDLSKKVDTETIDWLMTVGYSTPTKQNLDKFEIVCISDRATIKEFSKAATNPPYLVDALSDTLRKQMANGRVQNPQIDANLLFLFFLKPEERTSNLRIEREGGSSDDNVYWRVCTNLEIGLAASAIGIAANSIGMKSGFSRCIDHDAIPADTLATYNINPYHLEVMLGIGYPLYNDHTLHTDGIYQSESFNKVIPRKLII